MLICNHIEAERSIWVMGPSSGKEQQCGSHTKLSRHRYMCAKSARAWARELVEALGTSDAKNSLLSAQWFFHLGGLSWSGGATSTSHKMCFNLLSVHLDESDKCHFCTSSDKHIHVTSKTGTVGHWETQKVQQRVNKQPKTRPEEASSSQGSSGVVIDNNTKRKRTEAVRACPGAPLERAALYRSRSATPQRCAACSPPKRPDPSLLCRTPAMHQFTSCFDYSATTALELFRCNTIVGKCTMD